VKKLGFLLIVSLFISSMSSSALAASYGFHDTIGKWGGDGFFGRVAVPNYPGTYSYQHDIRDELDFAAGDLVTEAYLALDFDWLNEKSGIDVTLTAANALGTATAWIDSSTLFGWGKTGSNRPSPVPESSTMILLGMCVMGIAIPGRKKVFKKK
jgi:hypothetical protein